MCHFKLVEGLTGVDCCADCGGEHDVFAFDCFYCLPNNSVYPGVHTRVAVSCGCYVAEHFD